MFSEDGLFKLTRYRTLCTIFSERIIVLRPERQRKEDKIEKTDKGDENDTNDKSKKI